MPISRTGVLRAMVICLACRTLLPSSAPPCGTPARCCKEVGVFSLRDVHQYAQSVRLYVAKLSLLVLLHLGIHFGTHLEHIMVNWRRYGNIFTVARHWFPAPSHPHHTITTFQYILQLPQTSSHFSLQLPAIHSYKYSSTALFFSTYSTFQKCIYQISTMHRC